MSRLFRNQDEQAITGTGRVHLSSRRAEKISHEATLSPRFNALDYAWLDDFLLSNEYRSRGDLIEDGVAIFKALCGESAMPSWVKFTSPNSDQQ